VGIRRTVTRTEEQKRTLLMTCNESEPTYGERAMALKLERCRGRDKIYGT
jgi:hypothetical protein